MEITPIINALAKTDNIALLMAMAVIFFLCKLLITIRKEDREDRAKQESRAIDAQAKTNAVLDKVADTLVDMRITLAAKGFGNDRT